MNPNIECVIEACKRDKVPYRIIHKTQNVVDVNGHLFVNWAVPLLSYSAGRLCTDKDYSYQLFHEVVRVPKWKSLLSPFVEERFQQYLEYKNIASMTSGISAEFSFPVVIKPNSGSHGVNVLKCHDEKELSDALTTVFNLSSKDYDYVAIVQEYIEAKREARVIFVEGEKAFGYWKSVEGAKFIGNMSPLHWDGGKAIECDEGTMIKLADFMAPVFTHCPALNYVGADIIESITGELFLIELNCSPGFRMYVRDNGPEQVVRMYQRVIAALPGR